MNQTNSITFEMDPIQLAHQLSERTDRFAFFIALIVLGLAGTWLVRWLIGQNQRLVDSLNNSHVAYKVELEKIVEKQNVQIAASTEARVAHTEAIRENSEILRQNSTTLDRARSVLERHSVTAMLMLLPLSLLFPGCAVSNPQFLERTETRQTNGVVVVSEKSLRIPQISTWPATQTIEKQKATLGKTSFSFGSQGLEQETTSTNAVDFIRAAGEGFGAGVGRAIKGGL